MPRSINAGVSGDTSSDGLSRLDWSLADHPDAAIVEMGSNDALRGIDPGADGKESRRYCWRSFAPPMCRCCCWA